MLTDVTSLTGKGLKDWLIQRFSALYFAVYVLFLLGFLFTHPHVQYDSWRALFQATWFQIASVIALFMLSLHSWIGIWTVTTDYIKNTSARLSIQMVVALFIAGQFIWGLLIVWGQ